MKSIGIIYRTIIFSSLTLLASCTQPNPSSITVTELPANTLGGSGIVKEVLNGDSVLVDFKGETYNTRLACIDAMEYDAPLGNKSTANLREILPKNSSVTINVVDVDKYGRLIVLAWKNTKLINSELVRNGDALIYHKYLSNCEEHRQTLLDSEQEAKTKKVGYWGLPEQQQIEPWVWRKNRKK